MPQEGYNKFVAELKETVNVDLPRVKYAIHEIKNIFPLLAVQIIDIALYKILRYETTFVFYFVLLYIISLWAICRKQYY